MTNYDSFHAYKKLDKAIDELYAAGRYSEAVEKIENERGRHPEFEYELDVYRIFCLERMGADSRTMEALKDGVDRGWFYGLEWPRWDRYRERREWRDLLRKNDENKAAARKRAVPESAVLLPKNGSPPYPLFIVLHGDGAAGNLRFFQQEWKPDVLLSMGYAVAYFQSSQASCTNGFHWTADYDRARTDIASLLESVVSAGTVNPRRIFIGGFSGGSMASLNMMAAGLPGLKGVLALCPEETVGVDRGTVAAAAEAGVRMVLLDGEFSGEQPWQDQLEAWARDEGLPILRKVIPGEGHNVPKDWDRILKESALFLEG